MDFLAALGNPADSNQVRAVAAALAGIERDLHDAIGDHYEALGVEPPPDRGPPEERIEELQQLVEHHIEGDLWGYFVAEQAPEGLTNAEEARAYADLDEDRWERAIAELAESVGDEGSQRERADRTLRQRFGVDIETFETQVVAWSPERTLRQALRGPVDTDIERLRIATRALEQRSE
jgi:hypothetical protein